MKSLSVFTTIRSASGTCFFLDDHLHRVLSHAHAFQFALPNKAILEKAICDAAQSVENGLIRLSIEKEKWDLAVRTLEKPQSDVYETGVSVCVSRIQVHPQLCYFKTGAYLPYVLAYKEAQMQHAFEALLTNEGGMVVDGSKTSLILYENKQFFRLNGGLLGITREKVLGRALEMGYGVRDMWARPDELKGQLLLAGTGVGLVPVGKPQDAVVRKLVSEFRLS